MQTPITNYIPQRAPMIMINELVRATSNTAETRFAIPADNLFVVDGYLLEAGLIENIAQTAAAMAGYYHVEQRKPIPVGYIAAVKDLCVHSLPQAGSTINTIVTVRHEVLNFTIIEGTVSQEERVICSCEMKILINE